MRTFPTIIACCLVLSIALMGCGKKKAKDIVVSELETACDHVDAMNIVADEILELVGPEGFAEFSDLSQMAALAELAMKLDELNKAVDKRFERTDATQCEGWDELQAKSEKLGG